MVRAEANCMKERWVSKRGAGDTGEKESIEATTVSGGGVSSRT